MIDYNIDIHVPQQMENFLNAFAQGDGELLERIRKNLLSLVSDDRFRKGLNDYEHDRHKNIETLLKKAADGIKELCSSDNYDDLFIDIDEIRKDIGEAVNEVDGKYWSDVERYIVSWFERMKDDSG